MVITCSDNDTLGTGWVGWVSTCSLWSTQMTRAARQEKLTQSVDTLTKQGGDDAAANLVGSHLGDRSLSHPWKTCASAGPKLWTAIGRLNTKNQWFTSDAFLIDVRSSSFSIIFQLFPGFFPISHVPLVFSISLSLESHCFSQWYVWNIQFSPNGICCSRCSMEDPTGMISSFFSPLFLDVAGIYLFNGTCFAEASYSLVTTSVEAGFWTTGHFKYLNWRLPTIDFKAPEIRIGWDKYPKSCGKVVGEKSMASVGKFGQFSNWTCGCVENWKYAFLRFSIWKYECLIFGSSYGLNLEKSSVSNSTRFRLFLDCCWKMFNWLDRWLFRFYHYHNHCRNVEQWECQNKGNGNPYWAPNLHSL